MKLNRRVRGIIIDKGKILLIHRIKNGEEFYSIPGGGIEADETDKETLIREIREETNLDVEIFSELFHHEWYDEVRDETKNFIFFLIEKYRGSDIKIGGPELERHCDENQYLPEWHDFEKFFDLPNYYQPEVLRRLKELIIQK